MLATQSPVLLERATRALETSGASVPSGVGAAASTTYRGAAFEYEGRTWVVCRTALVSTKAQLLDATVAFKAARRADLAVAILDPPKAAPNAKMPESTYITRYRSAAWHGLDVVFATADELDAGWSVHALEQNDFARELDDLTQCACAGLRKLRVNPETITKSREAEAMVNPLFDHLLASRRFEPASTSYQSYWRRPRADGAWRRGTNGVAQRIHLEVKLNEDDRAPFCQVFEGLGVADAVLQVRLANSSMRKRLDALASAHPWLPALKQQVEARLPLRFIELR